MGASFSVDTSALGQIPSLLQGAQSWLAATRVGPVGRAAAAAAPSLGPSGIAAFGDSLDRFLGAGALAMASDMEALQANRTAYERTDLGAANLLGGGR